LEFHQFFTLIFTSSPPFILYSTSCLPPSPPLQVLKMKQDGAPERIVEIYEEFIEPSSPMEVNIDSATRQVIIDKVKAKTFDLGIFDGAIDELVLLIHESVLSQFLTAQAGKKSAVPRYVVFFGVHFFISPGRDDDRFFDFP